MSESKTLNRSQLNFHESFQPEAGYIAKIFELASQNYSGDKFGISEDTGIPTGKRKGKVEPHIKYATYMGLIKYSKDKSVYSLSLTDLGEVIYNQDQYLQEPLTKWLCHYGITRKSCGAPQWSFLVNYAHPGFIQSFSLDFLSSQAERQFGFSIKTDEVFNVVQRSYFGGFFNDLDYLSENSKIYTFNEIEARYDFFYVYAYSFLKNWEYIFPDKQEITMTEVTDDLSFGKIFGFNNETVSNMLDEFSDSGFIKINRQLLPATIIKILNANDIINLLYSRLL